MGEKKKKSFCYEFPRPSLTVDVVLVTSEKTPRVLLVRRKADPKTKSPGSPDAVEEVEHWRVVEGKALEAGDRVIVTGLQRVRDGTVVRPKPADFSVVTPPARPTAVAGK